MIEAPLTVSTDLGSWPRYNEAVLGFRNYWYPVMFSHSLRRKPKAVTICGEKIALFRGPRNGRDRGQVYALNDRCPHRGIPLSAGRCEFAGTVSCVYHGWTYDLASGNLVGVLTDGPDSPIVGKVNVKTYPVEERAGLIWIYIGEGTPPPVEDDIPEELLLTGAIVEGFCEDRKGNWRFGMENCIDAGHAKYLHRTAIWVFFREMGAWSQGVDMVPSEDGRWIGRIIGPTVAHDYYPGLGDWPKTRPWKKPPNTGTPGKPNKAAQLDSRLPCICRPGHANRGYQGYQIFVPIDATHHRAIMLSMKRARGIEALKFRLKYWADIFWVHDLGFQRFQDQRVIEMMSIPPERLYRPDKSITAWRRWCHETARTTPGTPAQPEIDSARIAFQASPAASRERASAPR
jgi:phenylpropionate dioxygenase-like ring-hydroxylating dioxygenase large terminal subunit